MRLSETRPAMAECIRELRAMFRARGAMVTAEAVDSVVNAAGYGRLPAWAKCQLRGYADAMRDKYNGEW